MFIWTKLASLPTWLSYSIRTLGTLPPRLLLIGWGFLSTPSRRHLTRMILPPSFDKRRLIRAWLVALAGLQWLLDLTWLQFIPSYHHTTASHPLDTWRLPFMLYIIFTPRTISVSTLHRRLRILFTLLSTSRTCLTLKRILTKSRLLPHINLLSHPTAMRVRALKLVCLSVMVNCFHYLNAAAWVEASSFVRAGLSHGLLFVRSVHLSVCAKLKFVRQTRSWNCWWGSVISPTTFGRMDMILLTRQRLHLYNDNESCVKWSHNMTMKQICHMEMRKNAVCEWVQDDFLKVLHVLGRINPADIFTKEMRDGAQFWRLRDSLMCPLFDFLQQSLLDVHLSRQHDECQPLQLTPLAASLSASFTRGSYLMAFFLSPLSGTLSAISHLSSAGRQIFCLLHRVVPSVLIWN